MQAVEAARKGMMVAAIAEAMGVAERSVFRWLASYASGGQQALLAKPIPGRPGKVSDEVLRWLARVVREETPLLLRQGPRAHPEVAGRRIWSAAGAG